ncbi:MAG: invasion associated locus B family protein [Proteobacteria bacterium]|nr:invasion associated locus B family protein [Pseudomonadota bacterium]
MLSIICARKHGAASARRRNRRLLSAALCACFLFASDPAAALTREEAAKVAEPIVALQPAFDSFAYDEEIVGQWFERDAAERDLIRAAGFTAESWKIAVGETFRGLTALEPQSEIDALRAKLDAGASGLVATRAATIKGGAVGVLAGAGNYGQQTQQSGQRVLAIELNALAGSTVAGVLVLPFGLSLDAGVAFQIDEKLTVQPMRFRTCLPSGCLVAVSFDAQMVVALRTGTALKIKATADSGAAAPFSISLQGFASALDRAVTLSR